MLRPAPPGESTAEIDRLTDLFAFLAEVLQPFFAGGDPVPA